MDNQTLQNFHFHVHTRQVKCLPHNVLRMKRLLIISKTMAILLSFDAEQFFREISSHYRSSIQYCTAISNCHLAKWQLYLQIMPSPEVCEWHWGGVWGSYISIEIFARFGKTEIVFDKSLSVQKRKGGKGPENEKLVERRTDGTIYRHTVKKALRYSRS